MLSTNRHNATGRSLHALRRATGLTIAQALDRLGPLPDRSPVLTRRHRRNPRRFVYDLEAGRIVSPSWVSRYRAVIQD